MITNVFVVDDHGIFRNGLIALLKEIPTVTVIGEASNGEELLQKIETNTPSIIFMDIKMPIMNGIEATQKVLKLHPNMKIIALSMYDEKEYLEEMMEAGALGYMLKNIGKAELESAINNLNEGKSFFCNNTIRVATSDMRSNKDNSKTDLIKSSLSNRELEILILICKGMSNKDISQKLFISPRTVGGHRNNMLKKTGFHNTTALVSFAINNNIVDLQ